MSERPSGGRAARRKWIGSPASVVLAGALLSACHFEPPTDVHPPATRPSLDATAGDGWSPPENLGPVVNSLARDQNPDVTASGLSLYFVSDRPGGLGDFDVWVSRRESADSPWGPPVNLGPPVNTTATEGGVAISQDGHLLFLHSNRPGTLGSADLWVSRRTGSKDEEEWEAPVNLGPAVNTADDEQGPDYVAGDGGGALYFNRGFQAAQLSDLYRVELGRDGLPDGVAEPIVELNAAGFNDAAPTVRADGREILFWSTRPGGLGGADIWASTRQSVNHPWSPPVNAASLNTPVIDVHPTLTQSALTLFLSSNRFGSLGTTDLWMSTRRATTKR